MKIKDVKRGQVYQQKFMGRIWDVRVLKLVYGTNPREWEGIIAGDQADVKDGDVCWGYVKDLAPKEGQ